MIDWNLLDKKIDESGVRKGYLYEQTGMTRGRWHYLRTRGKEPTPTEILKICEVLNITKLSEREQIFFVKE